MTAPHLRLVDTTTGELIEHETPEEENRALRAALTRAERSNRALKAQLAAERQKARKSHPIDDAFADWKAKLVAAGLKGKARCKITDDRVDAMAKLFDAGYTLDDFKLANTGLAEFQFVVYGKRRQTGAEDARRVDLGWCCEKASRFEEAARLGAVVEKATTA